jgi:hypothetical protein
MGEEIRASDDIDALLAATGSVFRTFDDQDSGCRSFGIEAESHRLFVKFAPAGPAQDSLARGVAFHAAIHHPALIPPARVLHLRDGLATVSPWVDGEVLYHPTRHGRPSRRDPASPHARFRAQPVEVILGALRTVFDIHLAVSGGGYVAVDLYDGCLLWDFEQRSLRLCDLDEYRPGPFVLQTDRLPGSTRFMAPEESRRGAWIDERTTVYNLGRVALVLLDEGDDSGRFRGPLSLADVAAKATASDPLDRFATVADLVATWRATLGELGLLEGADLDDHVEQVGAQPSVVDLDRAPESRRLEPPAVVVEVHPRPQAEETDDVVGGGEDLATEPGPLRL